MSSASAWTTPTTPTTTATTTPLRVKDEHAAYTDIETPSPNRVLSATTSTDSASSSLSSSSGTLLKRSTSSAVGSYVSSPCGQKRLRPQEDGEEENEDDEESEDNQERNPLPTKLNRTEATRQLMQRVLDRSKGAPVTLQTLETLIQQGANVNATMQGGTSMLELAINLKQVDVVRLLLEYDAYSNYVNRKNSQRSMLMAAVQSKSIEIVRILLRYNVILSHKDRHAKTVFDLVLNIAEHSIRISLLRTLLRYATARDISVACLMHPDPAVFQTPEYLNTLLLSYLPISTYCKVHEMRELIEFGADVDIVKDGATLLLHCIYQGHLAGVKLCLEKGANVNFIYRNSGNSPLMAAVHRGLIQIVEEILKYNPRLDVVNNYGSDVFRIAAGNGQIVPMLNEYKTRCISV